MLFSANALALFLRDKLTLMCFQFHISCKMFYTRGLKQAPRMPYVVRENVLAAPGAFWEFSNN